MSWEYRVARKEVHYPSSSEKVEPFGIIEVYYNNKGEVKGWTNFIDPNGWKDIDDLKGTIELMSKAFQKPVFEMLIVDDE